MRAFLAAKIGLLPFVLFWSLISSSPQRAIPGALVLSLALTLWRARRGETKQIEQAGLLLFLGLSVGLVVAPEFVASHALALSFFVLSAAGFRSLVRKTPWTADYSAGANGQTLHNPIFLGVNMAVSSLWAVLFLILGLFAWFGAPPIFAAGLTLAGAVASIFGPDLLVRSVLKGKLAAQQDFDWPAPRFDGRVEDMLDVAVIGAGIGGLTTAALLASAGLRVKIFEQHVLPGGFCHSWLRKVRHDGQGRIFRFDAGPHDFSGAHRGGALDRLLRRLGCADKIEWLRLDYRVVADDGGTFDPPRDWREHVEALALRHPGDGEGIFAVFEVMKAIYEAMQDGARNSGMIGPPTSVEDMLAFARRNPLFPQWAERRFVDLVERHVRGEGARAALMAMVGYISEDPLRPNCRQMAPIFGYYFSGGYYPRGGSSRFSDVLAESIRANGGEIVFKTGVSRILVEQGRAAGLVLDSGETVRARAVVANGDPRKTFLDMLDPSLLPDKFREKLASAPPATSGFAVHLGVDYIPEGQPLTHIEGAPSCFIARPGLVDDSDAPEGYAAIDLFTLLPHEQAKQWFPPEGSDRDEWAAYRRSEDYLARKKAFADALIAQAEKALPGLSAHIVYRCEASPVTYARYDWSSAGAVYGVAPEGRVNGSKSPIPGLVVAGAINFGPGVEAAAVSGAWAAEALLPGVLRAASASARQKPENSRNDCVKAGVNAE